MSSSQLLASAFNHVAKQPASKYLVNNLFLKASYPNIAIYRLVRYDQAEENMIWMAQIELLDSRKVSAKTHGEPPEGKIDLVSFRLLSGGYDEMVYRGQPRLSKIKGDVAQFQRDMIIIRMFLDSENEYDHLKNE